MISLVLLQASGSMGYMNIVLLIGIFVVFYFFMIRPQQKKRKEMLKFRNELKRGDKVITVSGVYGKIDEVKDDCIMLEIANGVTIKVDKHAIVKDNSDIIKQ